MISRWMKMHAQVDESRDFVKTSKRATTRSEVEDSRIRIRADDSAGQRLISPPSQSR